jgi:stage III sporulation protein AA
MRRNQKVELICQNEVRYLKQCVTEGDLCFCINTASHYSPWASESISQGFITASGGHRIGICGDAVIQNGSITGIRKVTSINIRVARDFPGIASAAGKLTGSVLLLGPPGSGKTTLLRDLIRQISLIHNISVVDERGELFPPGISRGNRTDILSGCGKTEGITILLRNMGPEWIAVDEITAESDCDALVKCGWCGVKLLASVHAYSKSDLDNRAIYRRLKNAGIFDHIIILSRDKSWRLERMIP